MKLKVTQTNLNRALLAVSRVANNKGTLPILGNILLKVENNLFSATATNLDIGITKFIGSKIEKEGKITVPSGLLSSFVASLPSEVINLELEGNKIKINTKQYNSVINGISAEEFPILPVIEKGQSFSLPAQDFKKGLNHVLFAASNNDSRPVLTGVYFYSKDGFIYLVATDSSRLSEFKLSKTNKEFKILIPASAMNDLVKIMDDEVETLNVVCDDKQVLFKFTDTELISRLLENNYPEYQTLIPKTFSYKATLLKTDLVNAVKISSLFAKETAGSLNIEINEQQQEVIINSLASQVGENSARAKAKVIGNGGVTLNSRFILEALNVIESNKVNFYFNSKTEPVLISDPNEPNYTHIIMPLKV